MIKLYIKTYSLFKNSIKLIKFVWFLCLNHVFEKEDPKLVILVVGKFLELIYLGREGQITNSRTVKESLTLYDRLSNIYLESYSEVTLNQLLEVLKTEFIERYKNGSKF